MVLGQLSVGFGGGLQDLNLSVKYINLQIMKNTLLIVLGVGVLIRVIGGFLGWF